MQYKTIFDKKEEQNHISSEYPAPKRGREKGGSAYRDSLKDIILETSMSMFAEKGIRAVKMDDIATRLSISKRTLYEIYEDKETLLFEGIKKYHHAKRENMRLFALKSESVLDIILYAYKSQVEESRFTNPSFYLDMERYPMILKFFEEEHRFERAQFLEFLYRGVEEGCFRRDINYELIACMFDALGKYVMSNQLYIKYSVEDLFNNLLFVSLRGFCTENGANLLDRLLQR